MTIYNTAFDTTACSGLKTVHITEALTKANVSNSINKQSIVSNKTDEVINYSMVYGGNSLADNIAFFAHPMVFNNGSKDNKGLFIKQLAVDVRNFGRWHEPNESFIVRNKPEYDWSIQRLKLNIHWLEQSYNAFRDMSAIPCSTYASLISECLGRRFALNPSEQITSSVLAAYFYQCLFTDQLEFDESEYNKVVTSISRATKVDAQSVFDILQTLDKKTIKNLNELTEHIKAITQNSALKDLNTGVLYAVCCNTWYGVNAREVMAVALEHPPTWLMIIYASLNEATFKKSILSKISTRFDKSGNGDNFIKSLQALIV
jgi:hypothetical protein